MCGEALFGEQWQGEMARALPVDPRLIRRWLVGARVVPDQRWQQIHELMRHRAAQIMRAAGELEQALPDQGEGPNHAR